MNDILNFCKALSKKRKKEHMELIVMCAQLGIEPPVVVRGELIMSKKLEKMLQTKESK